MDFRILGPLEVVADGRQIRIGGRQRTLLAMLLLRPNRFVGFTELVDAIWGAAVPAHPRAAVQTCVTRLRNALGGSPVIEANADGVRIVLDEEHVDLGRFEAGVAAARSAGPWEAEVLGKALALWRGEPFADVRSDHLQREVAPRLAERRLLAVERKVELDLRAGRHAEVLPELQALTAEHPFRERFWAQLMTALHRGGRQAEALGVYSAVRARLIDELGIEPGEELQRVHRAVLLGDTEGGWRAECQLPAGIADFVGRDDEVDQLLGALRGAPDSAVPIVTVSGPPGMGKSALVLRAAHQLIKDFPDGQWFLPLNGAGPQPRPPADLLAEMLRTAGVAPAAIPPELDGRSALLRSRLADRKVLLVLDDAGTVGQVAPLLPGRPGSAVLVTSRSELAGLSVLYGATRVSLGPLPARQAYDLLARIVGAGRCAEEQSASAELADLCGRLPLALRIAAANLAGRPGLAIGRYAEELRTGDRLAALRTRGEGGIAVRAAFDVSYDGLTDRDRWGFRLLGLVPGRDISAAGAAALFGTSADDALDVLDRLVAANLLECQSSDRYRFHDLIRVYAADRAKAGETGAARVAAFRRLADWYLHSVHAAVTKSMASLYISQLGPVPPGIVPLTFDDEGQAVQWLGDERRNYLDVITRAAATGPVEYSWLITDAARPDLHNGYRTTDLERVASLGLACARAAGDRRGEATMLLALGALKSITVRFDESIADFTECRRIANSLGETGIIATVVVSMAGTYLEAGRPAEGMRAAKDALELVDRGGVEQGQRRRVAAMAQLGDCCFELGRLREAAETLEAALVLAEEDGSPLMRMALRGHIGRVHRELADYPKARSCFREIQESKLFANVHSDEIALSIAGLDRDLGELDRATARAVGVLSQARTSGYLRCEAGAAVLLGSIALLRGEPAFERYEQGWSLARRAGTCSIQIEARAGMAVASGNRDLAVEAVATARDRGMRLQEAKALTALAEVELAQGHQDQARESADLALAMHRESGSRLGEGRTLTLLGHAGRPGAWQEALAVYEEIGSPYAAGVRALLSV